MLFGLIKSKKENAQNEYKEYLQKSINYMRKYNSRINNDPTDRHALATLSDFVCMDNKEGSLENVIQKIIRRSSISIASKNMACGICDDSLNTENEYFENELKILIIDFFNAYRSIIIPVDMQIDECSSWFYYWLIQKVGVVKNEP